MIDALNQYLADHPRRGFWKCQMGLRQRGHHFIHKRLWRVYCALGRNQLRRAWQRLLGKARVPLTLSAAPNQAWSADIMADGLYCGVRFRTFYVINDSNQEVVAIEIDTSITGPRLIQLFQQFRAECDLPTMLQVDNGPDFLGAEFTEWAERHGMAIHYIQPGKPNQIAFIERFNRTYREEVLDLYLFDHLDHVRGMTHRWLVRGNESWPHDSLDDRQPGGLRQMSRFLYF